MAFGPFSSESTATQKTYNVSDSGQLNQKSKVVQGGSVNVDKGANVGGLNLKGLKLGKGATLNLGPSTEDLQSLLGNLVQATPAQIINTSPQDSQASQTPVATPDASATAGTATDNQKKYLLLGAAALGALALLGFFKK